MTYAEFGGNENATISEVHEWILRNLEDGVICPGCDQKAKLYKRSLNSGMARDLIRLYQAHGLNFHHTGIDKEQDQSRGLSKLRYWGLTQMGDRGWWRVTEKGEKYVHRSIKVGKYAWTYNQRLIRVDNEVQIDIVDSLSDKFNYRDLMGR